MKRNPCLDKFLLLSGKRSGKNLAIEGNRHLFPILTLSRPAIASSLFEILALFTGFVMST